MSQNYEYLGKYILLEKLATGGMAEVWLARAPQAGGFAKFVAIKKILPQFSDNPEFIQMFKDEAKIAMNLSHSNIVSIYGYDKEQHQLYLVMDYVEGRNLRQILNKMKGTNQKLSISQIVYIIKEVAAGLDHAHRCLDSATGKPLNITHRDMSPQNIMISFEGEVKIVDFGIAKAESQMENTKTGTLKGKFGYMSPEQAEGQITDLRTDIFSLGIVLWELLANDRLFIANNEINTLRKIRECQVPSLTKINPNIHPELERITNKALTRDRNLRYQTAAAMHRDLSRFLNKYDPEFTPHDFAVFVKTLYTDEIMEARKKMVEYAKIPGRNEIGKQEFENEKTLVTSFPQQTDTIDLKQKNGFGNADPEQTITKTETFTDSSDLSVPPPKSGLPDLDDDKTEVSGEVSISTPLQTATDIAVGGKTKKRQRPDPLNKEVIRELQRPRVLVDTTNASSGVFDVETVQRNVGRKDKKKVKIKPVEKERSSVNLVFVIALIIAGYVGGSVVFPDEAAKFQNWVRGHLDLPSTSPEVPLPKNPVPEPPKLDPLKVPPWLMPVGNEQMTEEIPKTVIVIQSRPSGALIYINGIDTNNTTPARVTVPADRPFSLKLKKDRYLDYEKTLTAAEINKKFEATLQRALVSYVDIIVQPARPNVKLYVNNELLQDETIPVARYAIPAKTNVTIRAELPLENLKAETVVNLREDQRQTVILKLEKRR